MFGNGINEKLPAVGQWEGCKGGGGDTCRRVYHLIATLADPAMQGGQRWPSSSSGSRLRANSLLKSVLIW